MPLFPKRKGQKLTQVAGESVTSVINQITNTTLITQSIPDATPITKGKVYTSLALDVTAGTATNQAVTPDSLAGSSIFGVKVIGIIAVDATTDLSVADGKAYVPVPAALTGMNLTRAQAIVNTAGTTNATTIDIYNVTDSQDMLSGAISIASGETVGTPGTINTSYDDVLTNDVLRVDVTTMSTTAPKGLLVVLEFGLP